MGGITWVLPVVRVRIVNVRPAHAGGHAPAATYPIGTVAELRGTYRADHAES